MFGRWYWITNVIAVRTGVTELHLSLDVLAKARGAILDTKAFIEYGFNTFDASDSSSRIADARRPISRNASITTASASLTGGALSDAGSYILQVISADHGVSCYAVTYTQLQAIMLSVQSDIELDVDAKTAGMDADNALQRLVYLMAYGYKNSILAESAMSSIKSIHWLPISWGNISGTSTQIYLGNYATGQYGKLLPTNAIWSYSGSISIPWTDNDWKRCNTQIQLYLPFFGTVPVPVDQCLNESSVSFTISLDLLAGDCAIRVTCGSQTIYTGSTNLSAPFAVGVSAVSASAKIGGTIQSITGGLEFATGLIDAGSAIVGAAFKEASVGAQAVGAGLQHTMEGYRQKVEPLITSAGSMGGIAALGINTNVILTLIHYNVITDTDFESIYGHPVFKVDKPALGFCKTRGFSLSLGLEPQYVSLINSAMDGGVFVE